MRAAGPGRVAIRDYLGGEDGAAPAFEGATGRIVFFSSGENSRPVSVVGYGEELFLVSSEIVGPPVTGREQ